MADDLFFGSSVAIRIIHVCITPAVVTVDVGLTAATGFCPICGGISRRVHSTYPRLLGDLPMHGRPVRLRVHVRRFFCDSAVCPRGTFAEPLVGMTQSFGRKTTRLREALRMLGLELGGEAGARVSHDLAFPCSADRILHYIKTMPLPSAGALSIIGVDDFAFRKRERYGTIICDQITHRPVDILPDRSSEQWADWLKRRESVTLITRDRGGNYALGAECGAPSAGQVADRFHLLMNLRTALERLLLRCAGDLNAAWKAVRPLLRPEPDPIVPAVAPPPPVPAAEAAAPPPAAVDPKRARRWENYQQVMALRQEHLGYRTIATRLGLGKNTVRKFLHAGAFPERAQRRYQHRVAPFAADIKRRWEEDCHDAVVIYHELQAKGFDGSVEMVRRWVRPWRTPDAHVTGPKPSKCLEHPCQRRPSPQAVSWLLMQKAQDRDAGDQQFVEALLKQSPLIAHGAALAQRFSTMVRDRLPEQLDGWLADASAVTAPAPLSGMARSLRQDYAAVRAAIALPWSQGLLEGHVNRLKMIKRQMYGRAGFELLRHRVLCRRA